MWETRSVTVVGRRWRLELIVFTPDLIRRVRWRAVAMARRSRVFVALVLSRAIFSASSSSTLISVQTWENLVLTLDWMLSTLVLAYSIWRWKGKRWFINVYTNIFYVILFFKTAIICMQCKEKKSTFEINNWYHIFIKSSMVSTCNCSHYWGYYSGPWFNIRCRLTSIRNSNCGDKMVLSPQWDFLNR